MSDENGGSWGRSKDLSVIFFKEAMSYDPWEIRATVFPEGGLMKKHKCGFCLSVCGSSQCKMRLCAF